MHPAHLRPCTYPISPNIIVIWCILCVFATLYPNSEDDRVCFEKSFAIEYVWEVHLCLFTNKHNRLHKCILSKIVSTITVYSPPCSSSSYSSTTFLGGGIQNNVILVVCFYQNWCCSAVHYFSVDPSRNGSIPNFRGLLVLELRRLYLDPGNFSYNDDLYENIHICMHIYIQIFTYIYMYVCLAKCM